MIKFKPPTIEALRKSGYKVCVIHTGSDINERLTEIIRMSPEEQREYIRAVTLDFFGGLIIGLVILALIFF